MRNKISKNSLFFDEDGMAKREDVYFLSVDNLDQKILRPRVPDNYFTRYNYEDGTTPRVCFSPSISQCLMALPQKTPNMELYVHIPDGDYNFIKPTVKQVPDCKITGELWVTVPVKLKCIGEIFVIKDAGKSGLKFKYGNNTAELYEWEWRWVKKNI